MLPIKSYDPVHHLIRLLKECDADNPNIEKIECIIDGGSAINGRDQNNAERMFYRQRGDDSAHPDMLPSGKWNVWDVIKVIAGIGIGGIGGLFAVLALVVAISQLVSANISSFFGIFSMAGLAALAAFLLIRMAVKTIQWHSDNPPVSTNNQVVKTITIVTAIIMVIFFGIGLGTGAGNSKESSTLDEQTISQITTKWESDGIVDYTDVAVFEKAVNDGEDLVGKTVTFTVVEVKPDSALGFDLWGGEHLNFVSEGDPGVKKGEKITVIVTGVKHVLTDSYKISYVLLSK